MRLLVLTLFAFLISSETFAQPRGPRYNPNPGHSHQPGPVVHRHRGHVVTPGPVRRGPRVVGPRYNPHGSRRILRNIIRVAPRPIYVSGFYCSYNSLVLNGRIIHSFVSSLDCSQALVDIRRFGDYCDYADLYDMSGLYQGRFSSPWECRDALGWYY